MKPFSWVVIGILTLRCFFYQAFPKKVFRASLPVLVIGNIFVGGTGKTPVVIALVNALKTRGWQPGVISRGYGIRIGKNARAGQDPLNPALFGDEPALIAQLTGAPIAVHPNRKKAIQALIAHSPSVDLIISDDGLQHLALSRDMEIIVQDLRGVGNAQVMPAGPLREPVARMKKAHAIVTTVTTLREKMSVPAESAVRKTDMALEICALRNLVSKQSLTVEQFLTQTHLERVAAVAGIGSPERFFNSLHAHGVPLTLTRALPDHHVFHANSFAGIEADHILITAKDAIKCETLRDSRLWVVEVFASFSDPSFEDWLSEQLRNLQSQRYPGMH